MKKILLSLLLLSTVSFPSGAQTATQAASTEAIISGDGNVINQTINQTILYPSKNNNERKKEAKLNRRQSRKEARSSRRQSRKEKKNRLE